MAYPSSMLAIILIFVAVATPSAYAGITLNGTPVAELTVTGLLTCNTGPVVQPLSGASVELQCASQNVANTVTNSAGNYVFVVTYDQNPPNFNVSDCVAAVQLPVGTCTTAPPTPVATATLTLVGSVLTTLNGFVFTLVAATLQFVGSVP